MARVTVVVGTSGGPAADRVTGELAAHGLTVAVRPSSEELISFLGDERADVVLVFDDLPDADPLEVLTKIHSLRPDAPVVILVGSPSVADAVLAMRSGAHHYSGTELCSDELLDAVGTALRGKLDFLEESQRKSLHRLVSFEDLGSIDAIDSVLSRHEFLPSRLVGILQDIQRELRYLPQDALRHVSERLGIPLPRVFGVATFYKAFSLKPRGRHTVSVCLGTACHVQGGVGILEKLERELGISPGEMTYDERFSLECVRCVGCCGLAPVFVVDEDFHGKMTQDKVPGVLGEYE